MRCFFGKNRPRMALSDNMAAGFSLDFSVFHAISTFV